MQWSMDRNGGFSRADPASLVLPPIMDPLYGFQTVNVEAQQRDPHSLLNWMRRMLTVRKQQKAFGRGSLKLLAPSNRRIFAYLREYTGPDGTHETILCVANVSRAAQAAELELSAYADMVPVEMLGGSAFPPIGQLPYLLTLPPYGFYWFLLAAEAQMPSWHQKPVESMPEFATLVLKRLEDLLQPQPRKVLESESLPAYLPKRRWFAGKDKPLEGLRVAYAVPFGEAQQPLLLSEVEVGGDRYQLPLGFLAEEDFGTALPQQLALARVRRGRQVGLLTDAFTLESFVWTVLRGLREGAELACGDDRLRFVSTAQWEQTDQWPAETEVRYLSAEQSNSSVVIGGALVLKLLRRVSAGIHPELEMVSYLGAHGFDHVAAVLGEVSRVSTDGTPHVLMILQRYLDNQGDAWEWTQTTLDRAIRDEIAGGISSVENQYEAMVELEHFAAMLGQRLGEMHQVLAAPTDNPDFASETTSGADCQLLAQSVRSQVEQALTMLGEHQADLNQADREFVEHLLRHRADLLGEVDRLAQRVAGGMRIRVHGDLHLGQVLVVQGDAFLIDFEGEPSRTLAERRAKHSPYKDVAGVLRSIDYAAAMTIRNAQSSDTSEEADQARRRIAASYRHTARERFLSSYRQAAAGIPHAWQAADGEEAALALFSVEKTSYEIIYEAEHRPSWLSVPLQGLATLTQQLFGDPQ
jgi:maltose alpha-D-glucosyltransferase/alpha-amylase